MLSAESLGVIRETLPAVAGAIDEITPLFYSKMFAAHPELLRDLFNRGNQAAGEQPKALAASIAAFAGMVLEGNGAQYDSVLDRIAHKHASLGIVAEQYPIVYEHLFAAIAEVLGGAVTADVAKAWSEFYWLMADELIAREKALYDAAGVAPGDVWLQAIVVRRQLESADVAGFELRGVSGKLPNFIPGQYISVQVTLPDGARQIRQYSLSRGSTAGDWRIAVKRLNVGDTPRVRCRISSTTTSLKDNNCGFRCPWVSSRSMTRRIRWFSYRRGSAARRSWECCKSSWPRSRRVKSWSSTRTSRPPHTHIGTNWQTWWVVCPQGGYTPGTNGHMSSIRLMELGA